ncbi:MAG: NAD(P)/FAD-dependent oxidoreductase [Treponema sp.]|nr:NAD(P)/FAD-dependent oxidoreductase [Treponema sp.]
MKKVIVIGAGIAGLSAAIYAQRSGFDVTLCEQHSIVGGMCTSWKRKGYLFEGAVHWLTGSSPKIDLHKLWKDTGALNDNVKVSLPDPFYAVEHEGQTIYLYRDIKKTVKQLIDISPKDKNKLQRLVKDIKAFTNVQMPIYDIKGVKAEKPKPFGFNMMVKMLPALPVLSRLNKMSCKEYMEQFEHEGIQRLFRIVPDNYSAVSLIATLVTFNIGDGGYPEGGSLFMTDRMAKTLKSLGGKLLLNTKVKKINIEDGITTGVTLESSADGGNTIAADAVIVTQETIAAAQQLFDVPLDTWVSELCENTKSVVSTFVSIGIKAEIPQTPLPAWKLAEPITLADISLTELSFFNYAGYEGSFAPKGCTTLTTLLMGDTYDFWKKAKEEGRYEKEKQVLADQISRAICQKFPQASGNIEVMDIATPLTYERYTGAFRGSWMSVKGVGEKMKYWPGHLKNARGVFFAGHRMMSPGGLPVAVFSGRQAAQMVCCMYDMMFK